MQTDFYVYQVQIKTRIQNVMKYYNERIYNNIKSCTVIINTSVVRTNPSTQSSLPSSPALAFSRYQTGHDVDSTTSAHKLSQTSTCSTYIAHACARTQRTHTDAGARASPQTCRQAYKRSGNRDMRAYTMKR